MFSPQHSLQTPAVGTDTQVHALLHVHARLASPELTLTCGGGFFGTMKRDHSKAIRDTR